MLTLSVLKAQLVNLLNTDARSSDINFIEYLPTGEELDKFLEEVADVFNKLKAKTHCFKTFNEISYALFPSVNESQIIEIVDYDLNIITHEDTQQLNPSFDDYVLVSLLLSFGGNFEVYPVSNALEHLKLVYQDSGIDFNPDNKTLSVLKTS